MGSSLLDQQGNMHIVRGVITGSGTDTTVSSNDGSLTVAGAAAGDYTITFGDVFLSTPEVVANGVDTFAATDGAAVISIVSAATNAIQFNAAKAGDGTSNGALADMNVHFVVIGARNN